MAQQKT